MSTELDTENTESLVPAPAVLPEQFGRLCSNGFITTYLEYTKNQASPTLFHLWTAVSIIAGALRRNVYIDRGGYYTLYPNLYTVLVAPTGRCMKSTAASIGIKLLYQVPGMRILHEKITPEGLIAYLKGESFGHGKNGDGKRDPNTIKKIIEGKNVRVVEQNYAYIFAPELSVFLGGVSYTAGLIELLTSLYEGKDKWEYTTKTSGQCELHNVNVNLFGASNPEWLAKGFSEDAFGGGFMGRTIYIFQDEGKKVAWPTRVPEMDELRVKLLNDLFKIALMEGEFLVEKEAKDFYINWYENYSGDFSGRMAGYYERKPDHILKLAMILAASFSDTRIITLAHIINAIDMLRVVEELMPKAFAYIGATNEARISQHVLEVISSAPHQFISFRRLLSSVRHMVKNRREFEELIDTLKTTGQITEHGVRGVTYYTLDSNMDVYIAQVEAVAEQDAQIDYANKLKNGEATADEPKTIAEVVTKTLAKIEEQEKKDV